jgi:cytochrome c oxidase subunit IV
MAHEHSHTEGHSHEEHASLSKGKIWQVFFYLLGITVVEFFIALVLRPDYIGEGVANFLYIVLTLVKAFYIVAYFMHLKFEKYALITSIVISFVFIVYFIVLLLTEGSYLNTHMN